MEAGIKRELTVGTTVRLRDIAVIDEHMTNTFSLTGSYGRVMN